MSTNPIVFESVINLASKVQLYLEKYINDTESGINKCENILKELTVEERAHALDIDAWLIQLNKDIIIQRVENSLAIDENIMKKAAESFEIFSNWYKKLYEN